MRLEAIHRAERNTSPVKHSSAAAAAAARFGRNATDLRIVFLPAPQATSLPAGAAAGGGCIQSSGGDSAAGQAGEAGGAMRGDGEGGTALAGGRAAEGDPGESSEGGRGKGGGSGGEGGMLWRTQEFRRRLVRLASLPQPPVSGTLCSMVLHCDRRFCVLHTVQCQVICAAAVPSSPGVISAACILATPLLFCVALIRIILT